jgi:hypothetical protein
MAWRSRYVYAALFIAFFAVFSAYQFRTPLSVNVGGPIDGPLLYNVYAPEIEASTTRFRWTTDDSELLLRDWGSGNPVELQLLLNLAHPQGRSAELRSP